MNKYTHAHTASLSLYYTLHNTQYNELLWTTVANTTTVYGEQSRDNASTWRTCAVPGGFGNCAGRTRLDLHQLSKSFRLPQQPIDAWLRWYKRAWCDLKVNDVLINDERSHVLLDEDWMK